MNLPKLPPAKHEWQDVGAKRAVYDADQMYAYAREAVKANTLCTRDWEDATDYKSALRHVVKVLGPFVPASVTDEGARWEWGEALRAAADALGGSAPVYQAPLVGTDTDLVCKHALLHAALLQIRDSTYRDALTLRGIASMALEKAK